MFDKIIKLYKKYEELVNYVIVGGLTTAVSLGSYYLCTFTFFDPENAILLQCANVISWVLAVTFAFFANREYVFKSKNTNVFEEVYKFYGARVATLVLEMLFMYLTVTLLHWSSAIMKLIAQVVVLVLNYIISKFIVFIKKNDRCN